MGQRKLDVVKASCQQKQTTKEPDKADEPQSTARTLSIICKSNQESKPCPLGRVEAKSI